MSASLTRFHFERVQPLEVWNRKHRNGILADVMSAKRLLKDGFKFCETEIEQFLSQHSDQPWAKPDQICFIYPDHFERVGPNAKFTWIRADETHYKDIAKTLGERTESQSVAIVDVGQSQAKIFSASNGVLEFSQRPMTTIAHHSLDEEKLCQIYERESYVSQQQVLNQWFSEFWPLDSETVLLALPCEVDNELNLGTTTYLGMKNPNFLIQLREFAADQDILIVNDAELLASPAARLRSKSLVITLGTGVGGAWIP